MRLLTALLLLAFILSPLPAAAQTRAINVAEPEKAPAPRFGNVDAVNAKQMREWLTYIASDELEGRDTPSKGLDIAAKYIAGHLNKLGIRPAGDEGTYFQRFPLRVSKVVPKSTKVAFNGQQFEYGADFLTTLTPAEISASAVVFAGNGWVIKSKNINSYQGIDVKGKVVVVLGNSLPKGLTYADLKGPAGDDWMSPSYFAQANGAKAVITIATFGSLANWDASKWTQTEKGIAAFGEAKPIALVPIISASPKLITALFQGEKFSGGSLFAKAVSGEPAESFALKADKQITYRLRMWSGYSKVQIPC